MARRRQPRDHLLADGRGRAAPLRIRLSFLALVVKLRRLLFPAGPVLLALDLRPVLVVRLQRLPGVRAAPGKRLVVAAAVPLVGHGQLAAAPGAAAVSGLSGG